MLRSTHCHIVSGMGHMGVLYHDISVGSALLVLDWKGNCQSPKRWNGRLVQISTLFLYRRIVNLLSNLPALGDRAV